MERSGIMRNQENGVSSVEAVLRISHLIYFYQHYDEIMGREEREAICETTSE